VNAVRQTKIRDRYEAGDTFMEIAAAIGRSSTTVRDDVSNQVAAVIKTLLSY